MSAAASSTPSDTERLLLDLEAQRCNAMKRADCTRLREILHPDLVHVHAKGQTEAGLSELTIRRQRNQVALRKIVAM